MERNYDGYHFQQDGVGVFNPFSILNAFNKLELESYWFQTGTPTFLVSLLRKSNYDLRLLIDGIEAPAASFTEYRVNTNNPIPLIYQSGYLTIKDYDRRTRLKPITLQLQLIERIQYTERIKHSHSILMEMIPIIITFHPLYHLNKRPIILFPKSSP